MSKCEFLKENFRAEGTPQYKCESNDFEGKFPDIKKVFDKLYQGQGRNALNNKECPFAINADCPQCPLYQEL